MSRLRRNPNNWIRKEVSERINGMVVSGKTINVVDTNYTGNTQPKTYIDLTTQTKRDDQTSKCGWEWDCSILIDVMDRYPQPGNTGSRVLVNDIEDRIIFLLNDFQVEGGFRIDEDIEVEDSTSFDGHTDTEVYFRQLIRYRIRVTEPFTT